MTKDEFIDLTNEIDDLIDNYEHNLNCYYEGGNPYIKKQYLACSKYPSPLITEHNNGKKIFVIINKLKQWTGCKYSYKNNYKYTWIWMFLLQDDDKMLLKHPDIITRHYPLIKEFYYDLLRVYLNNFSKYNEKEYKALLKKNSKWFINLVKFFKETRLNLNWLPTDLLKFK